MVVPCLMGAFNSIGGSCFGWVGERIKTEAALLITYGHNIENLRTQVQNLSDAIKSVEDRIQEAENNRAATRVDAVVDRLLERMASLKEEASKIISDEERESDSTCLLGLRPNLWACYLTSKSAKKAIDKADELLKKVNEFDGPVATVDPSQCLGVTPIPDFEEFESRVLVSNQIVAALKDPSVNKVGVYGMGGTGKTTLAEKVGAELQRNGTFSYVVRATVSEKQNQLENNYQSDLTSIQKQIAGGLKIQLQGETLNDRATQLREHLQKRDKLLIILDDIWSKFELEKVGIPAGSSVHTKFKILMTSRDKMLLQNQMDSRKNFGLDSLPPDDAQKLFDKMVGGASEYSNWPLIAQQVVERCGGIPILLAATARALRNKTEQDIWEDALTQLKQFDGCDFDDDAYKRIEVSYMFLKDEEKKLFLLCAQLDHRSIPMEDLLKYTMGLDLFKERKKLKEVRGRLRKYLGDLKGCCLLQDGNEEGIIKMHDVVHKFASVVAFRDHHVFSVANDGELEEWPSKDQFEKFTAISFFYCRLPSDHELPVAFDNPKLESFLMLRNKPESFLMLRSRIDEIDASFKIPDNFFAGMKGLKLMNLTRISLSPALVSSLSALVKIRTLCLDHCELGDIAVIGELPMLQALSLTGSSIFCVPKEIGKLGSTLKLLDLLDCRKLESIASGVISKLTSLEDLRIGDSFTTWERLEGSDKRSNSADETNEVEMASLEEFKNLQNLINLEIHIPEHAKMFPKDLVFKKLETFRIFIEMRSLRGGDFLFSRSLVVDEASTVVEFDNEGTKALMTRAEYLLLEGIKSCVSVSEMDPKGFPELKHLRVIFGDRIQYIVKENYNNCIFPKLETLHLWYLRKLERIWDDHSLPIGSFENLRVITVSTCDLLNDLLSSNLARGLLRPKEIRVEGCKSMESIIVSRESENEEEIPIGFTDELRVLVLRFLPRLVSFYRFNQLEEVPSPTPLFNKKIMFPKLEELDLSWIKIEKIWDDHFAIAAEGACWFQNLTILKVNNCDNLSYLFTSSMVKSLVKLKQLQVAICKSMEEIVASTKRETVGEILLSFPKLDNLKLRNLPNLKRFCHANLLECRLLRVLLIQNCRELKTFISTNDSSLDNSTTLFSEKVVFPNMEKLEIAGCDSLEKVFDVQILPMNERETCRILPFQNLRSVLVSGCPTLTSVFSTSLIPTLQQLERLKVRNCESLEKVFDVQILAMDERETCRILPFQNLRSVLVSECPTLTSIFPASLVPTLKQLERLEVWGCDKIDLFGFNNTQQLNDAIAAKVFSSLKYFYLEREGIIVECEHQRIKLKIVGCGFQVSPILFALLKSFPKLDKVVVSSCSIIQLFPREPDHLAADDGDDMDTQAKTFALIQYLKLTKLSNMKHILSEHSPLKYRGIPRDLKVLEVVHCDSLLSLAPPSTTLFKNLTGLIVRKCLLLIKLVASSSTAKSLVNLKMMRVIECDSLEEIVIIDYQWDELTSNDECIVFEKLEVLYLQDLNSLTSFCSTSDCNFRFPSLNRVIVENCPKMKFFSKGALSTPKLIRVWPFWVGEEEEDEERRENQAQWEGDLNSTIQQLFEENQALWEVKEMEEDEEEEGDEDGDGDGDGDGDDDTDKHENEDEEV